MKDITWPRKTIGFLFLISKMINILTKRAKPPEYKGSIQGTKQSKIKDGETITYHPTIKAIDTRGYTEAILQ